MNPGPTEHYDLGLLPTEHRAALGTVTSALGDHVHGIGGSALLAILGIDVIVGDLDILLASGAPAPVVPWETEQPAFGPGPLSSAWVRRGVVDGVQVELIGGLRVRSSTGDFAVPAVGGGVVDVDGRAVALSPPDVWLELYRAYNPARFSLLESHLRARR